MTEGAAVFAIAHKARRMMPNFGVSPIDEMSVKISAPSNSRSYSRHVIEVAWMFSFVSLLVFTSRMSFPP